MFSYENAIGANDVSMIQMADVGVGICGQEGRQAVMASDFAMGQFQFLKRLLLVHGHWNYHRVGYLVLYNFYRNAVFVLMLFWYVRLDSGLCILILLRLRLWHCDNSTQTETTRPETKPTSTTV